VSSVTGSGAQGQDWPPRGQVISKPVPGHSCAPGWSDYYVAKRDDYFGTEPGWYSSPPDAYEYPKGTVWQCACGRTWVSTGPPAPNMPGITSFRPERWWERRRRERARKAEG